MGYNEEDSLATRIINGVVFVFMLPFYPFKKMLDYSDFEENEADVSEES